MTSSNITVKREIDADRERVWTAMTDPDLVSDWMMGAKVCSDWTPGGDITWSGEYQGQSFEDRGNIIEIEHAKRLVHTHYSPMSGADDVPENHHRVEWNLEDNGESTELTLEMPVESDEQGEEFERNWGTMLDSLKAVAER
jgi:uncharacterized protein YndB with AHSA1/START domain